MLKLVPIIIFMAAGLASSADAVDLTDVNGASQRLFAGKPTVVIFIALDCPISNGYAPEINRICEAYEKKDVQCFLAHADDVTAESARKHAKDFGFKCPVLIDSKHVLVKRAQATITPEAAVFSADGALKYHGRINDLYVDLGKKRAAATTQDLREAIDAVLAGKEVKAEKTQAVGCVIAERTQ